MKLSTLLCTKIIITLFFWAIPLLLGPGFLFEALGFPLPGIFTRLLGAAYCALTVQYYFGYREILKGKIPTSTLYAGIVSNGLAAVIIFVFFISGSISHLGFTAKIYLGISILLTASIAAGLAVHLRRGFS